MPENMTWWEAKRWAMAGVPVRRQNQSDPVRWYTYTTGLFYYHEEVNPLINDPSPADPTIIIVTHEHFLAYDFLATTWTTLGPYGPGNKPPDTAPPPDGPPDLPPPVPDPGQGNYPPNVPTVPIGGGGGDDGGGTTGGGGGGSAGGAPSGGSGDGNGPIIIVHPPVTPPGGNRPPNRPPAPPPAAPPVTMPTFSGLSADSGTPLVSATMAGIGPDQVWGITAYSAEDGLTWNLGSLLADGTLSHAAPGLSTGVAVLFRAVAVHGPQTLVSQTLTGTVLSAD